MATSFQSNDYYKILGCAHDSDPAELKRAFRKLAIKWHPDKNPNNEEATKIFQKISEAYVVLTNEESRKSYDDNRDDTTTEGRRRGDDNSRDNDDYMRRKWSSDFEKYMPKKGKNMSTEDIDNLFNSVFNTATDKNKTKFPSVSGGTGFNVYDLGGSFTDMYEQARSNMNVGGLFSNIYTQAGGGEKKAEEEFASLLPRGTRVYLLGGEYNRYPGKVLNHDSVSGMYLVQLEDSPTIFLHIHPSNLCCRNAF
mmetsp:Transcript_1320/g.1611  ORF Transcript_1320/g.1611 Transcript_1320/m.1611 type:complete len:252 (+) Transcript_1320:224-979(+)